MSIQTPATPTRKAVVRGEVDLVVHTFRGNERKVIELYHNDVDMMGWMGYVEESRTITGLPRGWKVLYLHQQKELTVTYRRLQ